MGHRRAFATAYFDARKKNCERVEILGSGWRSQLGRKPSYRHTRLTMGQFPYGHGVAYLSSCGCPLLPKIPSPLMETVLDAEIMDHGKLVIECPAIFSHNGTEVLGKEHTGVSSSLTVSSSLPISPV